MFVRESNLFGIDSEVKDAIGIAGIRDNKSLQVLQDGQSISSDLRNRIKFHLSQNKNSSEERLLEAIHNAVEGNAKAPCAWSKLMVLGQSRSGKTSTVNSLIRLSFGHPSTTDARKVFEYDRNKICAEYGQTAIIRHDVALLLDNWRKHQIGSRRKSSADALEWLQLSKEKLNSIKAHRSTYNQPQANGSRIGLTIWNCKVTRKVIFAYHHLFWTKYGVYLLAFNMEALLDNESRATTIEHLHFWLNSKRLHADGASVILVGTRLDKCASKDDQDTVHQILKKEVHVLKGSRLMSNHKQFYKQGEKYVYFPVDNKNMNGISALREVITNAVENAEYTKEEIPTSWLCCLDYFIKKKKDFLYTTKVCDYIRSKCGLDIDNFHKMLEFFHQRGIIVYFKHPESLRNVVVVQPQWLIDGITKIILDRPFHCAPKFDDTMDEEDFDRFINEGTLSEDLLRVIWSCYPEYSELEVQKFIKTIMENMLLLSCYHDKYEEITYIIPSLLRFDSERKKSKSKYTGPHFVLDFSSEFLNPKEARNLVCYLPFGLFERLVCLCITHSTVYNGSMIPEIEANYAKLSFGVCVKFEIEVFNNTIQVLTKEGTSSKQARFLVKTFSSIIGAIKKNWIGRKIAISLLVPSKKGGYGEYYDLVNRRHRKTQRNKEVLPNLNRRSIIASLSDYRFWL